MFALLAKTVSIALFITWGVVAERAAYVENKPQVGVKVKGFQKIHTCM